MLSYVNNQHREIFSCILLLAKSPWQIGTASSKYVCFERRQLFKFVNNRKNIVLHVLPLVTQYLGHFWVGSTAGTLKPLPCSPAFCNPIVDCCGH